mgnify:CR=1 FL=1
MTEALSDISSTSQVTVAIAAKPRGQDALLLRPARTQGQIIWGKFIRHKAAVISAVILLILAVLCFGAPLFAPYPFDAIDLRNARQAPSFAHLMGTDDLGRDVFTRILYGGRISLMVGIFAAMFSTIIGATVGAISGYYGGLADTIIMRIADVQLAFPFILLAIAIVAVLGGGLVNVIIVLGIGSWVPYARIVRIDVSGAWQINGVEAVITADDVPGTFGRELLARVPVRTPDGRTPQQAVRFTGADGPPWFLRAVFHRAAAFPADDAAALLSWHSGPTLLVLPGEHRGRARQHEQRLPPIIN